MIDSSFLYSSSWDFMAPLQDLSDLFSPLDETDRTCSAFENSSRHSDSSNSSSSDYDSIYFGGDLALPIADSLISDILEDSGSTGLQDDWSIQEVQSCTVPTNKSNGVKNSRKKRRKSLDYLPNKLWSLMSKEEQHETLHELSEIVTSHMGIREQIKVIKIIDPAAAISPKDTEFALDVSHLNDEKMKRIQELVRKHKFSLSNSSKKLKSSSKCTASQKQSQSSKLFSGRTATKTKRKQKKQKPSIDEDVDQKRKLELHGQKEIRSGLFKHEKVVKLSCPLEDEDVNILE